MSAADDARPQTAYKILSAAEFATLEADGAFAGSPDDLRDGYIHLSTADQLEATLARHFADAQDLHLAAIDLGAFGATLKWEQARDGQSFPHLYEPLQLETVVAYGPLSRRDDGTIKLPVAG